MNDIYSILEKLQKISGNVHQDAVDNIKAMSGLKESMDTVTERHFSNKDDFDRVAKVGDTYKTKKGTLTKTKNGVTHVRDADVDDAEDIDLDAPKRGRGRPRKESIEENTGATDYNPKSQGGTRKELTAKYHKTRDPQDAAAARRAGATQKELKGVAEGSCGSMGEAEMDEGNEFTGALAKAKAAGAKEFEVDGKRYQVKEARGLNPAEGEWEVYDTKTKKVHSTHSSYNKAIRSMNRLNREHEGYTQLGGTVRGKFGVTVAADNESNKKHKKVKESDDDVAASKASKAKIEKPAYQRKAQGGDWKVTSKDLDQADDLHRREFAARKKSVGAMDEEVDETSMTKSELATREKFVKGMKKSKEDFKKRYGDRGEEVMYATATKMAKEEADVDADKDSAKPAKKSSKNNIFGKGVYEEFERKYTSLLKESMEISVNTNSQGQKSVSVVATDQDADELAQLLNLSGMEADSSHSSCQTCGASTCGCVESESVEEEYANAPEEETMDAMTQLIKLSGGVNGPKRQVNPNNLADNPLAMKKIGKGPNAQVDLGETVEKSLWNLYKEYKG